MTIAEVAAARRNQVPRGIAYMIGSTAMFAGGNAVVKWQLATYPLGEVAFGRTLFAFLTVAAIVLPRAGWSVLRTRRYREHLQRGLSQSERCHLHSIPGGAGVDKRRVHRAAVRM
jgi:drug/metabolite transporter (DMT)-like permease